MIIAKPSSSIRAGKMFKEGRLADDQTFAREDLAPIRASRPACPPCSYIPMQAKRAPFSILRAINVGGYIRFSAGG